MMMIFIIIERRRWRWKWANDLSPFFHISIIWKMIEIWKKRRKTFYFSSFSNNQPRKKNLHKPNVEKLLFFTTGKKIWETQETFIFIIFFFFFWILVDVYDSYKVFFTSQNFCVHGCVCVWETKKSRKFS